MVENVFSECEDSPFSSEKEYLWIQMDWLRHRPDYRHVDGDAKKNAEGIGGYYYAVGDGSAAAAADEDVVVGKTNWGKVDDE